MLRSAGLKVASKIANDLLTTIFTVPKLWRFHVVWTDIDMLAYYLQDHGTTVTLDKIGHLNRIREYYKNNHLSKFTDQIKNKARKLPDVSIRDDFRNVYDFQSVKYSYRIATMSGKFSGNIETLPNGRRIVTGMGNFRSYDRFQDPGNIIQTITIILNTVARQRNLPKYIEADAPAWVRVIADAVGTPYAITGKWKTELTLEL